MQTKNVLILSLDEVKEFIYQWTTDTIINDRQNIYEHIKNGSDLYTNINKFTTIEMVILFTELELVYELCKYDDKFHLCNFDEVLVKIGKYNYCSIWKYEDELK